MKHLPTPWIGLILIISLNVTLVLSNPFDDFSDLLGPYCEQSNTCCSGREDSCAVPILGTLCYCDDFCNQTRVDDCCPDYWSFCRNIPRPSPPRIPTTTRAPELIRACTTSDGRTVPFNREIKENCNECKCDRMGDKMELICERNTCLVDPQLIETVNRNRDNGWTATNYSEFWGRTLQDGVTYRLGTLQPERFVLRMSPVRKIYNPNDLPKQFDAKTKWPRYIGDVQDQGWCGSSWAISTAAVASDRYGILSSGLETKRLSAQNLLSCDIKGQQSCQGGYLDRAWSFFRRFGLVDEDCFPYVAKNVECRIRKRGSLRQAKCSIPVNVERKSRYLVGPAYKLRNETDVMYDILTSGPVQATLKVYRDLFSYQGGIYRHTDLGDAFLAGYHSVRIVGWGEEYTDRGLQKYWKVANSWGPNWGENGYFRIARGVNECDIESYVLAVWPKIEKPLKRYSNEVFGRK